MDTISIVDMEVWTRIGVPEEERAQKQRLLLTVVLHVDTANAATSDDVSQTIDYEPIVQDIKKMMAIERKTIEKLVHDIATHILKHYKPQQVEVSLKKFVIPEAKHVEILIVRPS